MISAVHILIHIIVYSMTLLGTILLRNNNTNNKRTIVETDTNFNNYNATNYCWKNEILKFNSHYLYGKTTAVDIQSKIRR